MCEIRSDPQPIRLSRKQLEAVISDVKDLRRLHPERRNRDRLPRDELIRAVVCHCLEIHLERQDEYLQSLSSDDVLD